jgi:hypothetical protein
MPSDLDRLRGSIADAEAAIATLRSRLNQGGLTPDEAQALADDIVVYEGQHAVALRQLERTEAILRARSLIPPLQDGAALGATVRGQLRSEWTYRPDLATSYFRDVLVVAQPGNHDPQAVMASQDRLARNQVEAAAVLGMQERDVTSGDPGAGAFLPAWYLGTDWIESAKAGRPFADACSTYPYQDAGSIASIPRVQTAPQTGVQAVEADAVTEVDFDGEVYTVKKVTIAGQNDLSIQAIDWTLPGMDTVIMRELTRDYNTRLDYQLIYGASGQHRGLKTVVASDARVRTASRSPAATRRRCSGRSIKEPLRSPPQRPGSTRRRSSCTPGAELGWPRTATRCRTCWSRGRCRSPLGRRTTASRRASPAST